MKFIDEKGRIFGKINIFDLIVLLAVILVIGAVGYKIVRNNQKGQILVKTYVITVKCSSVPEKFTENLKKDDRIYYDSDGFTNGKIVDIKEFPAVTTVETDDGKLVETENPGYKDVYVDIEVQDKLDEPDIRVGRYAVAVGGKFTVKTIYAMSQEGLVLDIQEK